MDIDDETLMALADGEITGDAAARLHARIAADPDLAARYAVFTQSAQWVNDAARGDPDAAISSDLGARVREMAATAAPESDKVVPLRRPTSRWQAMAMAASLALVVGLSAGLFLAPDAPETAGPGLSADVQARLGTLPSGAQAELPGGRRVSVIASFIDGTGAFCREYETQGPGAAGYVSVACRADDTWDLRFAMATSAQGDGYAPAASLEALDAFYTATDASAPLDPDEEQRFLK
jgi:hypothetical protein